jgi:hypothetical protein
MPSEAGAPAPEDVHRLRSQGIVHIVERGQPRRTRQIRPGTEHSLELGPMELEDHLDRLGAGPPVGILQQPRQRLDGRDQQPGQRAIDAVELLAFPGLIGGNVGVLIKSLTQSGEQWRARAIRTVDTPMNSIRMIRACWVAIRRSQIRSVGRFARIALRHLASRKVSERSRTVRSTLRS